MEHLPERDRPPVKARLRRAWAGDRLRPRARAAPTARGRARPHAPRRRRLAARRHGRDADGDPARDQGQAPAHARVDEPVRVDDRDRPHARSATSSTGPPARWDCAGPPPGCSKPRRQFRKIIGYSDLATPRRRDRATTPPSPAQHRHDQGGRDPSHCVTITPGPPSPKFHGDRGNLHLRPTTHLPTTWLTVGSPGGQTTPTDSRSKRIRASRGGGQVLTRARSATYMNGLPSLRLLPDAPHPGRSHRTHQPRRQSSLGRSWERGCICRLSYRIPTRSRRSTGSSARRSRRRAASRARTPLGSWSTSRSRTRSRNGPGPAGGRKHYSRSRSSSETDCPTNHQPPPTQKGGRPRCMSAECDRRAFRAKRAFGWPGARRCRSLGRMECACR